MYTVLWGVFFFGILIKDNKKDFYIQNIRNVLHLVTTNSVHNAFANAFFSSSPSELYLFFLPCILSDHKIELAKFKVWLIKRIYKKTRNKHHMIHQKNKLYYCVFVCVPMCVL